MLEILSIEGEVCLCLFGSHSWNGNHDISRAACLVSYHIEQITISCHGWLCHCVPRNLVWKSNIWEFKPCGVTLHKLYIILVIEIFDQNNPIKYPVSGDSRCEFSATCDLRKMHLMAAISLFFMVQCNPHLFVFRARGARSIASCHMGFFLYENGFPKWIRITAYIVNSVSVR